MDNVDALVSIVTLVIITGAVIFGLRSLRVIHQNVNSNLDAIRAENSNLNEEVRKLLGREHDLETLQAATQKRAELAEKVAEEEKN